MSFQNKFSDSTKVMLNRFFIKESITKQKKIAKKNYFQARTFYTVYEWNYLEFYK